MARIDSLNVLNTDSGKIALQEKYGPVIENLMTSLISHQYKNTDLSGDPTAGSVIAKRFVNSSANDYGTARTANKGASVKGKEIVVKVDKNKEIIEEVEEKDTRMLGVDGLINKRINNHRQALALELEKAFFTKAEEVATEVTVTSAPTIVEKLDLVINTLKSVKNDFVNGVAAEDIVVTLSVKAYSAARQYIDKLSNPNVNTAVGAFGYFHGVKVVENLHQTADIIAMRVESIAQPVHVSVCSAGKLQLSDAYAFGLFYYYGTEAVTPDLIFKATI